jgi:penicillin-binding protein 1C
MRKFWISLAILVLGTGILLGKTLLDLNPLPLSLSVTSSPIHKLQILDRHAIPLTITYQNDWNLHDYVPLHDIPELLQQIFLLAEDKRFYEHGGPDWQARWHAMFQNLIALRIVRGASTITEQTVRMLYPRPRTFWSHWLQGIEASRLEQRFSKADILEFYLNQVPYANQRRGVVQAARYYFDRDLDTLSLKEMIALAVLIRAPSRLDLRRSKTEIEAPIARLAQRLLDLNLISNTDYQEILTTPLLLRDTALLVQATHFVNYVYTSHTSPQLPHLSRLYTTLDAKLQSFVQSILDQRIQDLKAQNVSHGAVLVVDHQTNEVLAWVNSGRPSPEIPGSQIDAVTTPRQPGSALKPFLYALALEKGWTAATLIDDTPLAEAVGVGLHDYRNYSRSYYGPLRLRDALGNSLNIPAIRTIQFVGNQLFLQRLHQLGIASLTARSDYYGDGLALGNGGVTLLELVQAYTVLAHQGLFRPLKVLRNTSSTEALAIFTPEITSIIADILSDPDARRLEFGRGTLLRFPIQTAVKTGTSSDYRDAWAIGFNHHYTVGVWLGNLDQQPMSQVSGATGSALILRAIFAELNRYEETRPLFLSPKLVKVNICRQTGQLATPTCPSKLEWFLAGTQPTANHQLEIKPVQPLKTEPYLKQPTPGLQLAMDPRIPDQYEAFALALSDTSLKINSIDWVVDDKIIGTTVADARRLLWPIKRGKHIAQAKVWTINSPEPLTTPAVRFYVK